MAWVREDDREVLDPRVGELTGDEYRELHALRQYVAREHPGAGGVFTEDELRSVAYLSPRGPRSVRPKTLRRLLSLGLVRELSSYSPAELHALETEERTNLRVAYREAASAIREARDELGDAFRLHRWELYNGVRDRTAAERQARYRARKGEGVTRDATRDVTRSVRARLSRPVPLVTSPPTSEVDGEGSDDLDFGELSRPALPPMLASLELDPARELDVVRLLGAVGSLEPAQADMLRGYASRAPEAVLARIRERLLEGDVRDRYAYALGTLKRELEGAG